MTSRFSPLHCLIGSVGFILLTRLILSSSGVEGELFRYLLPALLGGISGIVYTSFRYSLAQKEEINRLRSITLDAEVITNKTLNTTLAALHSSNDLILDSIGEGVYGVDHGGKTLFINRAVLSATGFDESQMLSCDLHELLHHTKSDGSPYLRNSCPVYQTLRDGKIRKMNNEIFWRKDGSSFPVEYIVTPTTEKNGSFGAVVIFRDISDRILIEDHLAKSEEQFRTLYDTSTDAILLMDRRGQISNANPATYKLFSCQDEKHLLGKALTDFSPAIQPDQMPSTEVLKKMVADGLKYGSSYGKWRLQGTDLKEIDVAVLLTRMDLGDTVFLQATIRDISDQKKNELQLQQARQELETRVAERTASLQLTNKELQEEIAEHRAAMEAAEQASLTKSHFLSTLSKEMQPPIESIMSIYDQMVHHDLPASHGSDLKELHLHSEHLHWLVSNILNFSQLESKKLTLVYTAFNIADSVQEILKTFALRAADKDISLLSDIQQTVPKLLIGDSKRLQIILGKLLDNGLKHTDHGEIAVIVKVREQLDDTRIKLSFSVRDTGLGIEQQDQEHIFDALSSVSPTTKDTNSAKNSISLSHCQKLVALMGGIIGVESVPGKGSHFWFDIAFATPEPSQRLETEQEKNGKTEQEKTLTGCNLLLADDEFINRRIFSSILEEQGAVVHLAEDGNEAIDLYKTNQIDCILMDVQMPHCNGFEAMEAIRRLEKTDRHLHTPAIALTAHAQEGYQQRCLKAGMDTSITKPVDAALLVQNIHELLQK